MLEQALGPRPAAAFGPSPIQFTVSTLFRRIDVESVHTG
jgi:hypothetical protein